MGMAAPSIGLAIFLVDYSVGLSSVDHNEQGHRDDVIRGDDGKPLAGLRQVTPPRARISYVTGDVSADGATIVLHVATEQGGQVDLSFPTVDLQHVVTLLLMLGGKAAVKGRYTAFSETFQAPPLPLHGVSLGVEGSESVLTVEVGAAVLSFSLTANSLAEIGRTILGLTSPQIAPDTAKPLSCPRNNG